MYKDNVLIKDLTSSSGDCPTTCAPSCLSLAGGLRPAKRGRRKYSHILTHGTIHCFYIRPMPIPRQWLFIDHP